jgi:hypothetical protein
MAAWRGRKVQHLMTTNVEVGMDDQRTPNLEEMDEQQAHRFLTGLMATQSAEEDYAMRHQDYTLEIPQSGERIQGRE